MSTSRLPAETAAKAVSFFAQEPLFVKYKAWLDEYNSNNQVQRQSTNGPKKLRPQEIAKLNNQSKDNPLAVDDVSVTEDQVDEAEKEKDKT